MRALVATLVILGAPGPAVAQEEPPATAAARPAAPPTSTGPPTPAPAPRPPAVAPTQPLLDKLAQGDRLFQGGDYRSALFAYQDAVYLQPAYAPARVRLGRAYLALRYAAQAVEQAQAALAQDPESAEARKLLDDSRSPTPVSPPAALPPVVAAEGATPRPAARIYKLTPEPDPQSALAAASSAPVAAVSAAPARAPSPTGTAAGAVTPEQARSGAAHYRAAIDHLKAREWAKADAELSAAVAADPTLAVAFSARGSARFGLGRYREAADDYRSALALDQGLATPRYGLAECYRALGDRKAAAEMYEAYAASTARDVRDDLRVLAEKRAQELR